MSPEEIEREEQEMRAQRAKLAECSRPCHPRHRLGSAARFESERRFDGRVERMTDKLAILFVLKDGRGRNVQVWVDKKRWSHGKGHNQESSYRGGVGCLFVVRGSDLERAFDLALQQHAEAVELDRRLR